MSNRCHELFRLESLKVSRVTKGNNVIFVMIDDFSITTEACPFGDDRDQEASELKVSATKHPLTYCQSDNEPKYPLSWRNLICMLTT